MANKRTYSAEAHLFSGLMRQGRSLCSPSSVLRQAAKKAGLELERPNRIWGGGCQLRAQHLTQKLRKEPLKILPCPGLFARWVCL